MPKKHGFSHALAGMSSTLLGGILIRITSEEVLGLDVTKYFGKILDYLPIKDSVTPETFTMSIFVFALCFIWGILFYYFHAD
jgi:hypothetical protein